MSGWRGIRYTDLKKILYPGRERDGPPNGGRGGFRSRRGCAPHFLFETSKRKCAAPGGKENMFGGSACAGAALLPPAGEGWQSLAAVRDGNAPPLGKPPARGGTGIPPAPLPAAAHAPAKKQAAPSEAEGAEREAGQMRSCTPTTSAPSATGRQSGKSQKSIACPKARPNRSRHWYADPRTRGGPLHRSAPGAFFSYTGRGAFSFWVRPKREWGAHLPSHQHG